MKAAIPAVILTILLFSSCTSFKDVQEPEYREIRDVKLIKVDLLQTTAGLDVVYFNPNNFSLQLTDAKGDIYIDNSFLGKFELGEMVPVKKHSEFTLPVVFKMDNLGTIMNQRDIFKKKEALVRIEGTARLKKSAFSREIPIKYESVQNLERFKTLIQGKN